MRPMLETLESRLLLATYYVDDAVWSNGTTQAPSDSNPGTLAAPFASLQSAWNRAKNDNGSAAGDTVIVKEGTYRQLAAWVDPAAYGGNANARFTIMADPAAATKPVFKASDVVTGWTLHSGNIWKKAWTTNSQQVFVDGAALTQLGDYGAQVPGWFADVGGYGPYILPRVGKTLADMAPGRFFVEFSGGSPQTLYVQLPDNSNPNNHTIEASVRGRILVVGPAVNYLDIKGLAFWHSNSSTVSRDDSAVWILSNTSATISECDIGYNDFIGINASGNLQVLNNFIHHNGSLGLTSNGDYVPETGNVVVRGNQIDYNNTRNVSEYHSAGGIKVAIGVKGMIIEENQIGFNKGPAVWFDIDCGAADRPNVIRNNYIHDNFGGNGSIMYEISKYGLIYNNLIVNNTNTVGGIYISTSSDIKVYNNTIYNHAPYNGSATKNGYGAIHLQNDDRGDDSQGVPRVLKNNVVMNNIVANTVGNKSYEIVVAQTSTVNPPSGNVVNYNLYYNINRGLRFNYSATGANGFDTNSVTGNPSFISAAGGNFQTTSSGAGVDKGATLSEVPVDYLGNARPYNWVYDIGAFEYRLPDDTPPTVSSVMIDDGSAQRSMVRKVTVVFSEPVSAAAGLFITSRNSALSGQLAYYSMNQGSGMTLTDESGNGNIGTLYGPTWVAGRPGDGYALNFDGVNDSVDIPDSPSLDPTSAFSVAGWFNHNSVGGNNDAGIAKSYSYRLAAVEANAAQSRWKFLLWDGGSSYSVTTTDAYDNNVWHAVVGTYDGNTIRIYVDGVLAGSATLGSHAIRNSTDPVWIGRGSGGGYYAGQIDDVRVLNRAMTASEVAAYSLAATATPSADMKTWELTFSGPSVINDSLPDGAYTLIANAANVRDVAGNRMTGDYRYRFHRLFGDADGDRDVDQKDLAVFKQKLNRSAGYVTWLDYDGSGKIDNRDYLQFRARMIKPLL